METSAVVKTLSSQRFKIFDRFRSNIAPKLDDHFTSGGRDAGNFVIHLLNVPAPAGFVTRRIDYLVLRVVGMAVMSLIPIQNSVANQPNKTC